MTTRDWPLYYAYLLLFLSAGTFCRGLLEIPTALDGNWYPCGFWLLLALTGFNAATRRLDTPPPR